MDRLAENVVGKGAVWSMARREGALDWTRKQSSPAAHQVIGRYGRRESAGEDASRARTRLAIASVWFDTPGNPPP